MWTWIAVIGALLIGIWTTSSFVRGALKKRETASFRAVGQYRHKRNALALWGLIGCAVVFGVLLRYLRTLTGIRMLDGSIGVALGLYICAHPAANAVNMLFFERDTPGQVSSEWSVVCWLALNLLVLLAGWGVIFLDLTRLVERPM